MDRFEVARHLGVADTEVLDVQDTDDGTAVRVKDGGHRLITEDGVFALTDHPATTQFRRWHGAHVLAAADDDAYAAEVTGAESGPVGESGGADPEVAEVPDGNADAVLDWVGDDPKRAAAALDVEQEREHPRSVLIGKLRKLAG